MTKKTTEKISHPLKKVPAFQNVHQKQIYFANHYQPEDFIQPIKKYSAIVLNWNESHVSVDTVKRLLQENIEVIVIDNGSDDGSPEKFKAFGDKIKFVALNKNYGQSIARNIGIDLSNSEFTFLIDGDILYVPETIRRYAMVLRKFPNLACVGYFDYERRKKEGWAHGTKERGKADTKCGNIDKLCLFYPMAWTQYGLFRTEVLKKYRFPTLYPFNQHGYGFEDDWLFHDFRKDGWTSASTNVPYYYHDAHFSIRELEKKNLDSMIKEREQTFNSRWGEDSISGKQLVKLKDNAYVPFRFEQKTVDVVMLSYTKDRQFFDMTQTAINTLHDSEINYRFNVVLMETNKELEKIGTYSGVHKLIIPNEKFHYNKFLNIGLSHCNSELLVISNNDVIFTEGWFSPIANAFLFDGIHSASSLCPAWTKKCGIKYDPLTEIELGYEVGRELFGHLIITKKSVLRTLGRFDERYPFWYQDNDYGRQLKSKGFKHGLVKKSIVYHLLNKSHSLLSEQERLYYTHGSEAIFKQKYNI